MSLSRQQITLLGIFALFLGPVILVMLMRSAWWQYQPDELRNLGYLVQPPVRLSLDQEQDIERKWMVLYVLDPSCDKNCVEHITTLRQIHRAAGRNSNQLAVILLSRNGPDAELRSRLESIYPEFTFIADSAGTALTTLGKINAELVKQAADSNTLRTYILDPMLNVILAYGDSADPNDIHKDLKRLLKWSDQENTQ